MDKIVREHPLFVISQENSNDDDDDDTISPLDDSDNDSRCRCHICTCINPHCPMCGHDSDFSDGLFD